VGKRGISLGSPLKRHNNDNAFDIPAFEISDTNIYPILDSAIAVTESGECFDTRMRYFHAFYISSKKKKGDKILYSIYSHYSIERALGVWINRVTEGTNIPGKVGVFYYKGYLFAITYWDDPTTMNTKFPFFARKACNYRIVAHELLNEFTYFSYINFIKDTTAYSIVERVACQKVAVIE